MCGTQRGPCLPYVRPMKVAASFTQLHGESCARSWSSRSGSLLGPAPPPAAGPGNQLQATGSVGSALPAFTPFFCLFLASLSDRRRRPSSRRCESMDAEALVGMCPSGPLRNQRVSLINVHSVEKESGPLRKTSLNIALEATKLSVLSSN